MNSHKSQNKTRCSDPSQQVGVFPLTTSINNVTYLSKPNVKYLEKAVKSDNIEHVRIFFECHPELLNIPFDDGLSSYIVHKVCDCGSVRMLELVVDMGARLDVRDLDRKTPLMRAASSLVRNTRGPIVNKLIERYRVTLNTKNGYTALEFAILSSNNDVAALMIQHGAKITKNARDLFKHAINTINYVNSSIATFTIEDNGPEKCQLVHVTFKTRVLTDMIKTTIDQHMLNNVPVRLPSPITAKLRNGAVVLVDYKQIMYDRDSGVFGVWTGSKVVPLSFENSDYGVLPKECNIMDMQISPEYRDFWEEAVYNGEYNYIDTKRKDVKKAIFNGHEVYTFKVKSKKYYIVAKDKYIDDDGWIVFDLHEVRRYS